MSHFQDLDEYDDGELRVELARRESSRRAGLCDYCGRQLNSSPACRFEDRHNRSPAALRFPRPEEYKRVRLPPRDVIYRAAMRRSEEIQRGLADDD